MDRAVQTAVMDMYLLSMCDYHILSPTSGFGQKAAFWNNKSNRTHIFYPVINNKKSKSNNNKRMNSKCILSNPTDPSIIASMWSGI